MKRCNRCNKTKSDDSFRIRYEKRKGNFYYLNNTCRKCDSELSTIYRSSVKDNLDWKQKNRERSNKYRLDSIDIVRERTQARRQSKAYKEYRKKYIQKNKNRIMKQERICKRRYHEKNRDALTDTYIINRLTQKSPLSKNEIPPALIKLKRLQIICKRSLKLKQNEPQSITHATI